MTDKMRWRYGDTNPVIAAVQKDTVIKIGDLVWQDVNNAKPASMLSRQGDVKVLFKADFLGVAMQRSNQGDDDPIRVACTGVFEFDCEPMCYELGDFIAPEHNVPSLTSAKIQLFNQQVSKTPSQVQAIGRVARRSGMPNHIVLVDLKSTVMTGGV